MQVGLAQGWSKALQVRSMEMGSLQDRHTVSTKCLLLDQVILQPPLELQQDA